MSQLLAVIFDSPAQAAQARAAIKQIQRDGRLTLQDAATVERDTGGKLHVHNEIDRDVKWGAGLGGVFGAALGFMFPIAGLAVGAAGGALIGKLLDRGLDKKFVNEVGNALTPGSSALVISVGDGDATAVRAALDPFTGKVFQTSLDAELESELNNALK